MAHVSNHMRRFYLYSFKRLQYVLNLAHPQGGSVVPGLRC